MNFINPNHRSSIHIHNCPKAINDAEEMTVFISDGYMRLKPLLYPCTIEFSLMCLTVNEEFRIHSQCRFRSFSYSI